MSYSIGYRKPDGYWKASQSGYGPHGAGPSGVQPFTVVAHFDAGPTTGVTCSPVYTYVQPEDFVTDPGDYLTFTLSESEGGTQVAQVLVGCDSIGVPKPIWIRGTNGVDILDLESSYSHSSDPGNQCFPC